MNSSADFLFVWRLWSDRAGLVALHHSSFESPDARASGWRLWIGLCPNPKHNFILRSALLSLSNGWRVSKDARATSALSNQTPRSKNAP